MRTKAAFLIGGAVGYVLGTRAGREQFEKIRVQAQKVWENPQVQETVSDVEHRASELVRDKAPVVKEKVTGAVKSASDTVKSKTGGDSGSGGSTAGGSTTTGTSTSTGGTGTTGTTNGSTRTP